MTYDNPAGRLLHLLHEGREIQKADTTTIKNAWRFLLEAEQDDSLLVRRLGWVFQLPSRIREEVVQRPSINADLYLRKLPVIEGALMKPLEDNWLNFMRAIDDSAVLALEFLTDALGIPAQPLDLDAVERLRRRVAELLDEVMGANIDNDLRAFLARHLQHMHHALVEVAIRGKEALRDAVEQTVGGMVLWGLEHGKPSDPEGKSLWDESVGVANGFLSILGAGHKALEVGKSIGEILS